MEAEELKADKEAMVASARVPRTVSCPGVRPMQITGIPMHLDTREVGEDPERYPTGLAIGLLRIRRQDTLRELVVEGTVEQLTSFRLLHTVQMVRRGPLLLGVDRAEMVFHFLLRTVEAEAVDMEAEEADLVPIRVQLQYLAVVAVAVAGRALRVHFRNTHE